MRLVDTLRQLLPVLPTFAEDDLAESTSVLVHILTKVGRLLGVDGILRHYKWREVAMAGILKHRVFGKASTGTGGDAADEFNHLVEYKTGKVDTATLARWLRRGTITINMVYNGAYGEGRIHPYSTQRHFYGLFDDETEECLLIYEADSKEIVRQLLATDSGRRAGATTNLNTVKFTVQVHDKRIVYRSDLLTRIAVAAGVQ